MPLFSGDRCHKIIILQHMFIEPHLKDGGRGWIEVITGSMFSGKTEELIRRLKRVRIANMKAEIFKPAVDVRYDAQNIVSHDASLIQSTPVQHSATILLLSEGVEVVGVDEAQFFDDGIVEVCTKLAMRGTRVIAAGLDMDYLGKPFGPMPQLLAIADYITKVHAICMQCGNIATHSYRKIKNDAQLMLGEKNEYEPRCRHCFVKDS